MTSNPPASLSLLRTTEETVLSWYQWVSPSWVKKKLVTALFLMLGAAVWADDFEDGFAAYNKGNYKFALSL